MRHILVINPGSTSTKIAVYSDKREVLNRVIRHDTKELEKFDKIADQYEFRIKMIKEVLKTGNIQNDKFDLIVGRGGLLKPIKGGAWLVNEKMVSDLKEAKRGEHACNLGAIIAHDIAKKIGVKAYTVNPVVVDELDNVARISGIPEIERASIFHALNQKATARKLAAQLERKYEDLNLIVAHMGGGITVGAHKKGRVVDVNNGLYGEGPFSPERSGSLPAEQLVQMCFDGKHTKNGIIKEIHGKGGMIAYLGTSDCKTIEYNSKHGNKICALLLDAMLYQIAKEIGSMAAVLNGEVDGIILTGGLAYGKVLMEKISKKISFIGKVYIFPGENEMEALRDGTLMALDGQMPLHKYV